ncbi:MAG: hypothetical protein ACK4FS_07530 [Flavobacterium sp.]
MKTYIIQIVLGSFFLYLSCKQESQVHEELLQEIRLLREEITALKPLPASDSVSVEVKDSLELHPEKVPAVKVKEQKIKPISVEKVVPKQNTNDTAYHYFKNGRLSVKVYPPSERQKILIYHYSGSIIQEYENVRMSYSVSHRFHFRDDGSVEKIMIHSNPGASRYWHESEVHFETDNEPRYMIHYQKPLERVEDSFGQKYLWNRQQKQWIKQEIIRETIMP